MPVAGRVKLTRGCQGWRRTLIKGEAEISPLSAWVNVYVVVGTSAGALIGLTFVVIALTAGRTARLGLSSSGLGMYNTPTVVHFAAVLLACALLSAPWPALAPAALLLGLGGLGGAVYVGVVAWRLRRWEIYAPVVEDWAFNAVLPLAAYAAVVASSLLLPGHATPALIVVGAAVLVLVVVGNHNAWDVVTYMSVVRIEERDRGQDGQQDGNTG
jgi:hypothetical protein